MLQRASTATDALRLIAVDIANTLGWTVEPRPDPKSDGDQWMVLRDGEDWIPPSPVGSLAGWMQHEVIDAIGTAWPRCPIHQTHPLRYLMNLVDGIGIPTAWHCDALPDTTYQLGRLSEKCGDRTDPLVPAGTVRWYLRGEGWGVIAGEGRDLWFNVPSVAPGSLPLGEGDHVTFDIDERPHDAFTARAVHVRRA